MPTATDEFVCPECQAPLSATGDGLSCSGCPAWYAVLHGVPLLLPGVTVGQGPMPDQDFVEEIARIAVPADGTAARESLRDLFSKRIAFPDPRLGIEGHRFLHRLRSSGFTVRNPDGSAPETAKADKPAGPAEGVARIGLTLLTAPAAVVAGRRFWVQVRIVNQGSATLRCEGPEALHFRYSVAGPIPFWRLRQSLRTPLLVDLPPGGELTQPVLLQAGSRSGRRDYRVTAATGGKRRLRGASLRVGVECCRRPPPIPWTWTGRKARWCAITGRTTGTAWNCWADGCGTASPSMPRRASWNWAETARRCWPPPASPCRARAASTSTSIRSAWCSERFRDVWAGGYRIFSATGCACRSRTARWTRWSCSPRCTTSLIRSGCFGMSAPSSPRAA